MKEEFTAAGQRDFRQRYDESWGFYTVPTSNARILVLMSVGETFVDFRDQKGNKYTAYPDTGVTFDFIPVSKRLFIHDGRLLLQQRTPARMWARGINRQNTRMVNVAAQSGVRLDFDNITAAQEPEKYQHVGNIHLLSYLFGIVDDVVYIYDRPIGRWDDKTNRITLDEPLFVQELSDLVKKLQLHWSVSHDIKANAA
jgi:hypothetical protein